MCASALGRGDGFGTVKNDNASDLVLYHAIEGTLERGGAGDGDHL